MPASGSRLQAAATARMSLCARPVRARLPKKRGSLCPPINSTIGTSAIVSRSTRVGVIDMQQVLLTIRSMCSDFAGRIDSSRSLMHASTRSISGGAGAMQPMRVSPGPTRRRSGVLVNRGLIERLTKFGLPFVAMVMFHLTGIAQTLPTVSVDRDGDTFHVRARASVAVDPRIAWDTITDYEHMREFLPNIDRSRVVARIGGRVIVSTWPVSAVLFRHPCASAVGNNATTL